MRPKSHPTIMKGLDCVDLSSVAEPILRDVEMVFITDDDSRDAMRTLADAGISAGPSGAASYAVARFSRQRAFAINTEAAQ